MPSVLIGANTLRGKAGRFREILVEAGLTPIDPAGDHTLDDHEMATLLPQVEAAIAGGESYGAKLLAMCPKLRVIARTGVGYDCVDVDAATRHRIAVAITPGVNHDAVAELAFALLLSVAKRVALNHRIVRSGGWDRTLVMPVRNKTLGLVGLGRIGRAMVPRAQAFLMDVIAYDALCPETEADRTMNIERVGFDELLERSDVVSIHCPLTPETRGWFDRDVFTRMRPGAILLNTARGAIVVEEDLRLALLSGHLAGAGLDVLDPEPPRGDNPLLQLDQVVISPHVAGIDTKSMADMADMAATIVAEVLAGRTPPVGIVNTSVLS
jgi:phosphoglycerate dehydrogenase-like enzyme